MGTSRTITRRRWVARFVALCVVLGLVSTLGVAWGFAFVDVSVIGQRASRSIDAPNEPRLRRRTFGGNTLEVTTMSQPGLVRCEAILYGAGPPGLYVLLANAVDDATPEALVPSFAGSVATPWTTGFAPWSSVWVSRHVDARGWPMVAVYSVTRSAATGPIELRGGVVPPGGWKVTHETSAYISACEGPVVLPYFPIWPGLLADTAFYGAGWAVVLLGASAVRRWFKVRVGCCGKCGYDLRGLSGAICPECGETAAPRSA